MNRPSCYIDTKEGWLILHTHTQHYGVPVINVRLTLNIRLGPIKEHVLLSIWKRDVDDNVVLSAQKTCPHQPFPYPQSAHDTLVFGTGVGEKRVNDVLIVSFHTTNSKVHGKCNDNSVFQCAVFEKSTNLSMNF